MKKLLFTFAALLCTLVSNAQIGYQVSLLNTATGEPRANETVSCVVELKNSEGGIVCSETKSATSNDLGVISLSVGNAKTFDNMDWSKLPLYVSVTIDGKLIGQSQVLTVPVAECAKTVAPNTNLLGTWYYSNDRFRATLSLQENGKATISGSYPSKGESWNYSGSYVNYGDIVFVCTGDYNYVLCHLNGRLYLMDGDGDSYYYSR